MSQSEDYLDGLLNSVSKAKSDISTSYKNAEDERKERLQQRTKISPDDDFLKASGISSDDIKPRPRTHLRQALSESDFLRDFENDLDFDDADTFIQAFEAEIEAEEIHFEKTGESVSEDAVSSFLNDIDDIVNNVQEKLDEEPENLADAIVPDEDNYVDTINEDEQYTESENTDENIALDFVDDDDPDPDDDMSLVESSDNADEFTLLDVEEPKIDESIEEDDGLSLGPEELEEFAPDELDEEDNALSDETEVSPLADSIGEILSDGLDTAEFDINDLFGSDDTPIEEQVESVEPNKEDSPDKKGKKAKKDKKDKKPNPFLEKLSLIFFGAPTEEELAEQAAEAEAKAAKEAEKQAAKEAGEDPKEKKKKEKEEAKKAKDAEKKAKAEEKKAKAAAAKEAKPKKEKKQKEPDNSPKIPIKVILFYLVLAASLIAFVFVLTKLMGIDRHTSVALEYYESQNYVDAYALLNGLDIDDEDQMLLRNRSRMLADLQQKSQEALIFYDLEEYNLSLDSLVQGVGRYHEFREDAVSYEIVDEYDRFGQEIINTLYSKFGVKEDEALEIYNSRNRHQYTLAIRKILISLGLKDK